MMINRSFQKCLNFQDVWLMGKNYQEALSNIELVISEWLETAKMLGREIPEPKGRLIYA
jgi:predicted RNase H-like HicB family nuclease